MTSSSVRQTIRCPALPYSHAAQTEEVRTHGSHGENPSDGVRPLRCRKPCHQGKGKPETFNFLGFTHISGKDRNGRFMLIRKTRRDRMTATLKAIKDGLRRRWHYSIPEQGKWLRRVVQGYLNYHSVPGNFPTMQKFRTHVTNLWRRALRRRSQKDDTTWTKANKLAAAWLPRVRVLHPWPVERFTARHPRQEPGA